MERNHLIFTLGIRGSVGKTVSLVTIADYLQARGEKFVAVDCDTELLGRPTSFAHWFGGAAVLVNLREEIFADELLEVCRSADEPFILADFPPNTFQDFFEWQTSIPLSPEILEQLEMTATGVAALAARPGVGQSAQQWINLARGWASCVLAVNHPAPVEPSNSQDEVSVLLNALAGGPFASFQLPYLAHHAMNELIALGELPSQAVHGTGLSAAANASVKAWIEQVHSQLEKCRLFLPASG